MSDFETVENIEVSEVVNGLQVYQHDKALIDIQISTAKSYPRKLKRCIENAITIVTLDNETASECIYSLKKGGKTITGPSVNLAKILAQQMGNMRVENTVMGYDSTHVTASGICFDLENNFAVKTTIKKSIVGNNGRYSEDMCVITGNAANAIALRNAIFAVIDKTIVKKVYDAASKKLIGDVGDDIKLISRRNEIFNKLKSTYSGKNLTEDEILKSVNKNSLDHITRDDLVSIVGFETSIRSGENSFETIFRPLYAQKQMSSKPEEKSEERLLKLINSSKNKEELKKFEQNIFSNETRIAYDNKWKSFKS